MRNLCLGKNVMRNCFVYLFFFTLYTCFIDAANAWFPSTDLSSSDKDGVASQVAVSGEKNCSAVWSKFDGNYFIIQTAQCKMGENWSVPVNISEPIGNAFFAKVVNDPQNGPLAIWAQNSGTQCSIQALSLTTPAGSNPVTLSNLQTSNQKDTKPQIAIGNNGYSVVAWQKSDGVSSFIQAVTRNHNEWSQPENLTLPVVDGVSNIDPQVAIDSNNNTIVVWVNVITQTIQASIRPRDCQWSLPVNLSKGGIIVSQPQVAFDLNGNPIVVWTQNDGITRSVQTITTASNGRWKTSITLSENGYDAVNPRIALDLAGNAIVVWQGSDGVNTIIQSSLRKYNQKGYYWGAPINLSIPGEDASDPQMAVNAKGLVGVIWKRSNGANFIIQVATKYQGKPWRLPVSISMPGEDAARPQIALDIAGSIVTTWERSNGKNSIIQSAFGLSK